MKFDKVIAETGFKPITLSIIVENAVELVKLRTFLANVSSDCISQSDSDFAVDLYKSWSL